MLDWNAQTWISLLSALVSVIGACLTLYWTRRRMLWDAGRELGVLRGDALSLIAAAHTLDHPTWTIGIRGFQEYRHRWRDTVVEKEPLMSARARKALKDLDRTLTVAETEVFGVARVFSDDPDDDPDVAGTITPETRAELERVGRLLADPHFLSK